MSTSLPVPQSSNAKKAELLNIDAPEREDPSLELDTSETREESLTNEGCAYFARFGSLVFAAEYESLNKADGEELEESITSALKADSRVTEIRDHSYDPEWLQIFTLYPDRRRTNTKYLIDDDECFDAIRFSSPFYFKIQVPIKNQPLFKGRDDVPTDTYFAAWDGLSAIIIWERDRSDKYPPRSGGHILVDILRDAAKKTGNSLYVQACQPACTNVFAHTVVRLRATGQPSSSVQISERDPSNCVDLDLPCGSDDALHVLSHLLPVMGHAQQFTRVKNHARRIIDLEDESRQRTHELLAIGYERELFRSLGYWSRLKGARHALHNRKNERYLVSALWLYISLIEGIKRDLDELERFFVESMDRYGTAPLFKSDMSADDDALERLDTSLIQSSLENARTNLENRAVVWATLTGAFAALAGTGIGLLVH